MPRGHGVTRVTGLAGWRAMMVVVVSGRPINNNITSQHGLIALTFSMA